MAAASKVECATCHPDFISNSAVALANTIFLRKEPVEQVLTRINAAAVRQIDHTRTVSLVVQQMIQELRQRDFRLASHVKYELIDRGVSTYINYWKDVLSDTSDSDDSDDDSSECSVDLDAVDSSAVAAYIGDYYTLGYLSTEVLTTCVAYIVNNFKSLCHLRCVEMILERAHSSPVPRLEPAFILECVGTIRRRAHQLFGKEISIEEDSLTHLLYRLLFNEHNINNPCDHWDSYLSASEADDIKLFLVPNNYNGSHKMDHHYPRSSPSPILDLAPRSAAASRRGSLYGYPTYNDLVSRWEAMDAVSPDPADLPSIECFN